MEEITYKIFFRDKSVFKEVIDVMKQTNHDFVPPLSDKFKLEDIAQKYIDRAHIYISYFNNKPCGLVAFYPNIRPKDSYLSMIMVNKEYRGKSIGKNLELLCLDFCKENNSKGVMVNMRKSNERLLQSRQELGYKIIKEYQLDYSAEPIVDLYLQF